jgi:hypothetical protein
VVRIAGRSDNTASWKTSSDFFDGTYNGKFSVTSVNLTLFLACYAVVALLILSQHDVCVSVFVYAECVWCRCVCMSVCEMCV